MLDAEGKLLSISTSATESSHSSRASTMTLHKHQDAIEIHHSIERELTKFV